MRSRPTGPGPDRYLHLLDVENLVGGYATPGAVRRTLVAYQESGFARPDDQVVVALSHRWGFALFEVPACWQRHVTDNGRDAADLDLLHAAPVDFVTARFGGLVIGSGDGIFAPLAESCHARGTGVLVVTGRGLLSAALHRVCDRHLTIPLTPQRAAA